MRGEVIAFDPNIGAGAIGGEDRRRYDFTLQEWRGPPAPARGLEVEFTAAGDDATQIYPLAGERGSADTSAKLVYILYLFALAFGITSFVGVIVAFVNKDGAPPWLLTHYRLQIRTFWIGIVYALVGLLTAWLGFGVLIWGFTVVWWIVRCAKGLKLLGLGQPYDRPDTWLW